MSASGIKRAHPAPSSPLLYWPLFFLLLISMSDQLALVLVHSPSVQDDGGDIIFKVYLDPKITRANLHCKYMRLRVALLLAYFSALRLLQDFKEGIVYLKLMVTEDHSLSHACPRQEQVGQT